MLHTVERCWFAGIRMPLCRRKCAVWRPSDYMRWNDCFKEERAAVWQCKREGSWVTHCRREDEALEVNGEFVVSTSFCVISTDVLPTSYYFPLSELGGRTRLNMNYRLLPGGFSAMDGIVDGRAEGYSADIMAFVRTDPVPRANA